MKKQIRLTESELHCVIENAVKKIVNEYTDKEKKRMYGYRPYEDEEDAEFNEQPTNNIVGESVNEMQWPTYQNAFDKARNEYFYNNLPAGKKRKRMEQMASFFNEVQPAMRRDYGLTDDQVNAAIDGQGEEYDNADRRALRNMDRLHADRERYKQAKDPEDARKKFYKNGKWF